MIPFITATNLNLAGIAHGFFTREGGVSEGVFASLNCAHGTGDKPENVDENLRRIAAALRAKVVLKSYQVHSSAVHVALAPWSLQARPQVDAIVTKTPGLAIGVTTADCVPILFADARAKVVGVAHAGWKGALNGILENTVQALQRLGAQASHIQASIGPCIQQESYEVGLEFYAAFLEADADNVQFFVPSSRENHYRFNLSNYVHSRLARLGLAAITEVGLDTCADAQKFFSYRRTTLQGGGAYGCQFSAIALTE